MNHFFSIFYFQVGTCVEYSESLKDGKICGILVKPLNKNVDLNDDEEIEEQVWHGTGKRCFENQHFCLHIV